LRGERLDQAPRMREIGVRRWSVGAEVEHRGRRFGRDHHDLDAARRDAGPRFKGIEIVADARQIEKKASQ
jgi:hypothetical protein